MLQFVCECDVVKDTGKEEYLRPFIHIGLDWIGFISIVKKNEKYKITKKINKII